MINSDDNKALLRHIIEDLWHTRQGLEELSKLVAPNYVHHAAIGDYNFEGFRGGLGSFIDACPDVRHVITHLIAEGDYVAAHVKMTGTHTGPFGAVAATGKVLTLTGACFNSGTTIAVSNVPISSVVFSRTTIFSEKRPGGGVTPVSYCTCLPASTWPPVGGAVNVSRMKPAMSSVTLSFEGGTADPGTTSDTGT